MKLIIFTSELEEQRGIANKIKNEIVNLRLDVEILVNSLDVQDDEGFVIIPATGGTERRILSFIENSDKPILLWAIPYHNSLPAALEVYAYVKDRHPVELFYSEINSEAINKIKSFKRICTAINKLEDLRLGCIGSVSEWILTSDEFEFGSIAIDFDELLEEIERVKDEEIEEILQRLSGFRVEVSKRDLIKSAKVYIAMKNLVDRYNLSAITVKCFDLLDYDCTACIALSLLNDDGVVAGCEGDLYATYTMAICSLIANKPCWMANPCRINCKENTITFAHCTIPTKIIDVNRSILTTHMESKRGVAIDGTLKCKDVTIARLSGNKMLLATGRVVRSGMKINDLCRTQVEVKLTSGDVMDFLENSLGNHHILMCGNLKPELLSFCKFKGFEVVELD